LGSFPHLKFYSFTLLLSYCFICWRCKFDWPGPQLFFLDLIYLRYTQHLKKCPCTAPGTRFEAWNCISEHGTQEPYWDIFLEIVDIFLNSQNIVRVPSSHLKKAP
jgi:hypothetical protein